MFIITVLMVYGGLVFADMMPRYEEAITITLPKPVQMILNPFKKHTVSQLILAMVIVYYFCSVVWLAYAFFCVPEAAEHLERLWVMSLSIICTGLLPIGFIQETIRKEKNAKKTAGNILIIVIAAVCLFFEITTVVNLSETAHVQSSMMVMWVAAAIGEIILMITGKIRMPEK